MGTGTGMVWNSGLGGVGYRFPEGSRTQAPTTPTLLHLSGPGFIGQWRYAAADGGGAPQTTLTIGGRSYPPERFAAEASRLMEGASELTFQEALQRVIADRVRTKTLGPGAPLGRPPSEKRGNVRGTEVLVQALSNDGGRFRVYYGQGRAEAPPAQLNSIVSEANALLNTDMKAGKNYGHLIDYVYQLAAQKVPGQTTEVNDRRSQLAYVASVRRAWNQPLVRAPYGWQEGEMYELKASHNGDVERVYVVEGMLYSMTQKWLEEPRWMALGKAPAPLP